MVTTVVACSRPSQGSSPMTKTEDPMNTTAINIMNVSMRLFCISVRRCRRECLLTLHFRKRRRFYGRHKHVDHEKENANVHAYARARPDEPIGPHGYDGVDEIN